MTPEGSSLVSGLSVLAKSYIRALPVHFGIKIEDRSLEKSPMTGSVYRSWGMAIYKVIWEIGILARTNLDLYWVYVGYVALKKFWGANCWISGG